MEKQTKEEFQSYQWVNQLMYLGRLASIIDDAQEQIACILGDYNAAPATTFFKDI